VWAAVLFAFEVEPGDTAKDVQPGGGIPTDFDLGLDRAERIEGLVQQVADHAGLRLVAGRSDIVDGEVVVDAQVALDEPRHLPVMIRAVEALEDEDVAAAGRAAVALATALLIGMRQRGANSVT
jgi:hypothetical protein